MMVIPIPVPSYKELQEIYEQNLPQYQSTLSAFAQSIREHLRKGGVKATVKTRVKSLESLYQKISQKAPKLPPGTMEYTPTDLMGMRIVCPFLSNILEVEDILQARFTILEKQEKGADLGYQEFGYESLHFLIKCPGDLAQESHLNPESLIEIQVRTLLQDAWAEVEHQLIYKSESSPLDEPMRRRLAALSANLNLSDIMFQEIRDYQNSLHNQLYRRRHEFWNKFNSTYDSPLRPEDPHKWKKSPKVLPRNNDQKLLEGLLAHNDGDYQKSIAIYSQILESEGRPNLRSIIHVHRGMAYFSMEQLQEAMEDFTLSLKEDPENSKGYLYRGLIRSLKKEWEAALTDYAKALQYDPFSQDALLERAKLNFKIGNTQESEKDCAQILHINPDHGKAKELLEKLRS